MPSLNFYSLECHKPQDSSIVDRKIDTSDEVYLVVGGKRIWGIKSMSANDIEDLSIISQIEFLSRIRVDLYDRDVAGGPFSSTDHLGGVDIMANQVGKGEKVHTFAERGANYSLKYEVV
jgi:hypothetical protein